LKKKADAVESATLTAAENNEETMMALDGIKKSPKQGAAYWAEVVCQGNENWAKKLDKYEKKDDIIQCQTIMIRFQWWVSWFTKEMTIRQISWLKCSYPRK